VRDAIAMPNETMQTLEPEQREALWERIEDLQVGMLTTVGPDGSLLARPMTVQDIEPDGTLWFFTIADSAITEGVTQDTRINASFADVEESFYVSITGRGYLVDDRERIEALWTPFAAAWFPGGPADPKLWLLRIDPQHVDYWTSSSGKLTQMLAMAKAAWRRTVPGPELGEHGSFVPPAGQ
jgi:general stress protein 26